MATRKTTSDDAPTPLTGPFEPARVELAWEAASEIEVIAGLLRREAAHTTFTDYGFEAIFRTSLRRIEQLAGVGVSALGSDDEATTALHQVVWHTPMEAAHG